MKLSEAPVIDVRGALTAQRQRLLAQLGELTETQWAAPTEAPQWRVKDIALHLLDVDLSWLARDRDSDDSGMIPIPPGHDEFVNGLAQRNQRWIDGASMLSSRLITDLLAWSGEQLDAYLSTVDLSQPSAVYWAGDAPLWFDIAREFTERWVHFRQITAAALPPETEQLTDEYLPLVLHTFIWAFPHQYHVPAPPGTAVAVEIPSVGAWSLVSTTAGWILEKGHPGTPAATLRMTAEAAWRLLTGAAYPAGEVSLEGEPALAEPLLNVRGIIV